MTVLNSVQTQLSGTGVVFPSDPTAIVDALTQGECKQAADLLAAANGQTLMANPVFNEQINSKFDDIEQDVTKTIEAAVSCWGIFGWTRDECQYVQRFLFKINQAATAKIPIQTAPTQKSTTLIEVTDLTIGQTDYDKISVLYKGDPTQSYVIDVTKYQTTDDGFVLKDKTTQQVIFEVKVSDQDQIAKRDALIQYVFGGKTLPVTVQKPKAAIKNLTISQKGMQFIQGAEVPVDHVYNDGKGKSSDYCQEHTGHIAIPEKQHECVDPAAEQAHNTSKKGTQLPYSNPTIGVGHLIYGETELQQWCSKQPLSDAQMQDLFRQDLDERGYGPLKALFASVGLSDAVMTQCQFDALVSIVYNRGAGGLKSSTLWKNFLQNGLFNSNDQKVNDQIKDAMINDGSKLAGKQRRKDEADLYFNCNY